ncbi:MAG: nucleotidyltransferase domain-containing protein [Selenomonadaceae bacterium]|nr:nucleotidyltransferase domain-containing protein [Selenomonadaceae bacterium]
MSGENMSKKYLEKIRQMILDFMKDEAAKIYLFGSWARGEQKKSSDVDIAVDYFGKYNRKKFSDLRELFEESSIPYRVDIVDLKFSSAELLDKIKKEGIIWKDQISD